MLNAIEALSEVAFYRKKACASHHELIDFSIVALDNCNVDEFPDFLEFFYCLLELANVHMFSS